MRFALFILTSFLLSCASASDWVPISHGTSVTAYIDNESIRFRGSDAKVWTKWVYTEPQKTENTYPAKSFQSSKDLSIYRCVDRTSATIQSVKYADATTGADGGELVESYTVLEKNWFFEDVVPDTMGETIMSTVCKKMPKSKK